MSIINSFVSWVMLKRLNQIDFFRKNPVEVQQGMLFELLEKGKDTEFGRKHGFDTIRNIADFQERVPLHDYEQIKPYIERVLKGEKNILWPGEVKWFAKSSGTTSDKSKFIPVTKDALENCHFRGGKDAMAIYYSLNKDARLLKGKGLIIGGSHQINNLNNTSFYGDLSAVLIQNMPFWAHLIRTPELSIALMDEWEEKIEKMAHTTLNENVTSISGVPSWTLVLIKRLFEIAGTNNLLDIWPDLELFIHGGVSFEPYREQFKAIIPSEKMHYLETYNASEGFFGIQDDFNSRDMLLMLDYGIFYEFVPVEELNSQSPKVYSIGEVEKDVNYALVISSTTGLWRYLIGDTIRFSSLYPFKFIITGRTKHFINAFGEELIVDNADKALKVASERTNAVIREYTAAPVYLQTRQKGRHQWLIDFEKQPDNLEHFTEILDTTLKALNSDYEAKRYKSIALELPEVIIARPRLFYYWLKTKGKLGGQHKVPRLSNSRTYMEELLKLNTENEISTTP